MIKRKLLGFKGLALKYKYLNLILRYSEREFTPNK